MASAKKTLLTPMLPGCHASAFWGLHRHQTVFYCPFARSKDLRDTPAACSTGRRGVGQQRIVWLAEAASNNQLAYETK